MTRGLLIGGLLLAAAASSGARRPPAPASAPPRRDDAPPAPKPSPVQPPRREPEDPNVLELKTRVTQLVNTRFRGDRRAAFNHYAPSGRLDRAALTRVLEDAGVGNMFTRGAWVHGVMEKLDVDRDDVLTWAEFTQGIAARSA